VRSARAREVTKAREAPYRAAWGSAAEHRHSVHVEVGDARDAVKRLLDGFTNVWHARIGNEQLNLQMLGRVVEGMCTILGGQVDGNRHAAHAMRALVFYCLCLECLLVPRCKNEVVTAGGSLCSNGAADARGSPCYNDPRAFPYSSLIGRTSVCEHSGAREEHP
jgi:hypothetical protein